MFEFSKARQFFSKTEKERIMEAIQRAEAQTSGEIRIHVESSAGGETPFDRAKKVFKELRMTRTKLRNGVLIYLAVVDRKFAIIGDAGIDQVVPSDFWETTKETMRACFVQGKFVDGVVQGINLAGEHLQRHFPCNSDDVNELTDEISEGR